MPPPEQEAARGREAIEVSFARFEGTVSTELKNIAHDVKGVLASLAGYATTRDLSTAEQRLEQRIARLEKTQTFLFRTIAGAAATGLVSGAGYVISLVLKVARP